MDIATILGIVFGIGVVLAAIFVGGDFVLFVDIPSMLIVVGGAMAATIIRYPITGILSALVLGGKVAFTHKKIEPRALIEEIANLADLVRKNGPLGLENAEVDDEFLAKGMHMSSICCTLSRGKGTDRNFGRQ